MQHVSRVSQASHVDLQATSPLKCPDQLWQVTGDPVIRQRGRYCKDITAVYVCGDTRRCECEGRL